MSIYSNILEHSSCKSINDIIELCGTSLPSQYKARPWTHPELKHGTDLLYSDEALNCYMYAYGEMHINKCRAAMMNFPFEKIQGAIEIVDWGCGQGIGSATVVDILRQRDLIQWVKRVTLIEPSEPAIRRAEENLLRITNNNIEINSINKYLPSEDAEIQNVLTSVEYKYSNVIHIFSNILDVDKIDLAMVARLVAASQGKHFILCIGPKNSASFRIEQFCSIFGEQQYFSKIDSGSYGRTTRTNHNYTCFTRCFVYDGSSLDYSRMSTYKSSGLKVFGDYDIELQIQNKVLSLQKARIASRLQNILAIDDKLYIDPVINEVTVDFIIIRPNKGILLITLFDKNLNDYCLSENKKELYVKNIDGKSEKNTENILSPFELNNICQLSIKDCVEELLLSTIEDNRNFGLIKKAVIFSENSIEDIKKFWNIQDDKKSHTYFFGNEFISNPIISQSLFTKLNFIYNSQYFDDIVRRKITAVISPLWHSYQDGKLGIEPEGAQKKLVVSIQDTKQKISGVAGSGKTFVLAKRAINAMKRTGGDVLVLTFNKTLVNYLKYRLSEIREDFSWTKIDVYHYHQFFRIQATKCHRHVHFDSYEDVDFFNNTNLKHYSAIFVDEVQDYKTEWLRIVMRNFLNDTGEFVVFGDPTQNVYHRELDTNNDIRLGVIGGTWNKELNSSKRFINPRLANLSNAFKTAFIPDQATNIINDQPLESELSFQIVKYFDLRKSNTEAQLVSVLNEIIKDDRNEVSDFVVLGSNLKLLRRLDYNYRNMTKEKTETTFATYEKFQKIYENTEIWKAEKDIDALDGNRKLLFTTDKRCLKISTIQSFKGWESPSVIVLLEEDNSSENDSYRPMAPESIYTAITRARENLYVINIGNDTYDEFFRSQVS